jgi:hypothetical protein
MQGTLPIAHMPELKSAASGSRPHAGEGLRKNNPHNKRPCSVAGRFRPTGV